MHRFALNSLKSWFERDNRKPLVIRGARQVGKTELVRLFAKENQIELIELNLEEIEIGEFEKEKGFSIERALSEIHVLNGIKPSSDKILFLDEIQNSRYAYSRLRYFKEKLPELPIIAAGSLLEVEIRKNKTSVPA
jgi:uncharacterized protein